MILVVDEDLSVLMVTSELLKADGYDVVSTQTVADALKHLGKEKFQLVVTDYRFLNGSGEDVILTTWRKQLAASIFIITSERNQLPVWLSEGCAVTQVFTKPYVPARFLAAAKDALTTSTNSDEARLPSVPDQTAKPLPKGIEEMVHRVVDQESIVAITDKKGTIVYANDRFCEISGYSRRELLGQNHRLLKSGRHPAAFYKSLWGTILSGRTWRGEICNKAKDGHLYYVDTTITPLREEGLISHFIAIRTDITARKEAEMALTEQGKREEEDRRMTALGRMADGVLHDLNNILTGIMGIASATEKGEHYEMLHEAIDRMAQLTRTLRDYSTGRPTKPEPFRLNPLLACACSLVRHRKGVPKTLCITEQIDPTKDVVVNGNEGQIFEVVLNLVVNAIEAASASAQPKIIVGTEINAGLASIRVEDNGAGVTESMVHSIFEPFTSTKGQGRGVGLSVSKSIVVAHGGELRLERAGGAGRGACFLLTLPVQVDADRLRAKTEDPSSTPQRHVVLVSEDEDDVRRIITENATEAGLTVINAGDLADLLALAAKMKEVLAAAILDSCEIDSDNGAVACLRRLSPGLPIILISGSLTTRGKRLTPWGEVQSLPKPFGSDALMRTLNATIASQLEN